MPLPMQKVDKAIVNPRRIDRISSDHHSWVTSSKMHCIWPNEKTLTPALGQNGMSASITKGEHDVYPLSISNLACAIGVLKQKYDLSYTADWVKIFDIALRIIEAILKFAEILEKLVHFQP